MHIIVGIILLSIVVFIVWIGCGVAGAYRICTPGSGRNGCIWIPIGCLLGPLLLLMTVLLGVIRHINENRFKNRLPEFKEDDL